MRTSTISLVLDTLAKQPSTTMLGHFGTRYGPWKILIGTILSARSKDEVTKAVCERLFKKYGTAAALASAPPKEVERIIKKIGFYHTKAKHIIATSRIVATTYQGNVPDTLDSLLQLPGVGRKVAGCVLVYAFHQDAIPVDTHVHRISNRLGWVRTRTPAQTERELMKIVPRPYWQMVNDMLVSHGKRICKPITPLCSACCIERYCKKVGVKRKNKGWPARKKE